MGGTNIVLLFCRDTTKEPGAILQDDSSGCYHEATNFYNWRDAVHFLGFYYKISEEYSRDKKYKIKNGIISYDKKGNYLVRQKIFVH